MSNSGEEEHLSTPTEESNGEEERIQTKGERLGGNELSILKLSKSKTLTKTKSKMTLAADSSDHGDLMSDDTKMSHNVSRMMEENQILKKQLKKQEERIKLLATKLIRMVSERSNKTKREEILLEEQKSRIADLEHEVSNLRYKLQVSKQQLSSYTKLIPHPPSRQTSMLSSSTVTSHSKLNKKPRSARSSGSQPPRPSTANSSRGNLLDKNFADRVEELLLEAKAENQALEDQLKHCRQRLITTEEELERTKESLKSKDAEHQEEILAIKAQLDKEQDVVKKKKQLSDNIQLIRLQRESRRTASWLSTLEAQCRTLETSLASATESVQELETQLAEVQEELRQEQQKNITLQKQMEDATSSLSRLKELEAQITALQEENKILKEANESLLKKAFSVTEKAEKAESTELTMRTQMSHLETVLKSEIRSKNDLQESLRQEKEKNVKLESANGKLQSRLDKLNEEMKKFHLNNNPKPVNQSNSAILSGENSLISCKASSSTDTAIVDENCSHQKKVVELEDELTCVKHQLNVVRDEHNKTKALLRTQISANKEYQREVEELTARLDKADEFHHKKLQDFVKVLEERTRQISHLEKCMDEWKLKKTNSEECCTVCGQCRQVNVSTENDSISNDVVHSQDSVQDARAPVQEEVNDDNQQTNTHEVQEN